MDVFLVGAQMVTSRETLHTFLTCIQMVLLFVPFHIYWSCLKSKTVPLKQQNATGFVVNYYTCKVNCNKQLFIVKVLFYFRYVHEQEKQTKNTITLRLSISIAVSFELSVYCYQMRG